MPILMHPILLRQTLSGLTDFSAHRNHNHDLVKECQRLFRLLQQDYESQVLNLSVRELRVLRLDSRSPEKRVQNLGEAQHHEGDA